MLGRDTSMRKRKRNDCQLGATFVVFLFGFITTLCTAFTVYDSIPSSRVGMVGREKVGLHHRKRSCTPTLWSTTGASNDVKHVVPVGALGPPEIIRNLNIGENLRAFRRINALGSDDSSLRNFTIERVSFTPDCFVMRDFLSLEECDVIITEAAARNMTPAETITEGDSTSRRYCDVAWIESSSGGKREKECVWLVNSLVQSTANIFLSNYVKSDPQAGVEDLQVLKYGIGGEFVLHQDGEPRVLTIIYYVNGVGGTWFPLARTSNSVDDSPCRHMDNEEMNDVFAEQRKKAIHDKEEALKIGMDYEPGKHGLLVKGWSSEESEAQNPHAALIKRGDAIAFYNYLDDGSGRLDWRALHTGLPTREEDGVKWIANHWFRMSSLTRTPQ